MDFCALIEHQLYYIAHKKDLYRTSSFNRETGMPKLTIQGHDFEEFIGVVSRYGANKSVQMIYNLR